MLQQEGRSKVAGLLGWRKGTKARGDIRVPKISGKEEGCCNRRRDQSNLINGRKERWEEKLL